MDLLLDTHIFLWFFDGDQRLSEKAKNAIMNPQNNKLVSILSLWEFSIKKRLNKMDTKNDLDRVLYLIDSNDFRLLNLTTNHCKPLLSLPFHHKDPFDRMLIAQAITEDLTFVTQDQDILLYKEVTIL